MREDDEGHQQETPVDVSTDIDKVTLKFINLSKEILYYNYIIIVFNVQDEDVDQIWKFEDILGHRNQVIP